MSIPKAEPDPRVVIREGDMTGFQVIVVTLCILVCALDGFDVLVVAFTAAAIARDFHLNPTDLGILLSAGLAGMGFGALRIGPLGDKLGRRSTVLLCLAILCVGMLGAAVAGNLTELALIRLFTGLGIGGVLANINIVVAEYASDRWRNLSISLLSLCYPVGATLGGAFSVYLISAYGWRSVYVFGGLVALLLVPALIARQPSNALAKVNRVLGRMGRPALARLPVPLRSEEGPNTSLLTIFRPPYAARTAAVCVAYFCVMMTCY